MNQRSGGDESITIRPGIWHMKGRASLGNCGVNRQDATGEGG
jgi:hypothetical protein